MAELPPTNAPRSAALPSGADAPTLPRQLSPILSRSQLAGIPLHWTTEVPQPFHRLLVHDHDMTSELERFHESAIDLRVLQCQRDGDVYLREVTLHSAAAGKPVEYGLIEILLDAFPAELHAPILAGETPLGAILNAAGFAYGSRPQGFFSVSSNRLEPVLGPSSGGEICYGRYNHLIRGDGELLARILEILPSANAGESPENSDQNHA